MSKPTALESLAELREEIDRIDGEMHELLIERGGIIDKLIAVKARQGGGSAFRPGREADMMRVIASRHRGRLPLDTVESIWRVIISTFTFVQSHYSVHADMSGGDAAMRDSARFHFGFTVPLRSHASPGETIAAVAGSARPDGGGDLGMISRAMAARGRAMVGPSRRPGRAQDHRPASFRRAARSSRGHAGLHHFQSAGRGGCARCRAVRRAMARRGPRRFRSCARLAANAWRGLRSPRASRCWSRRPASGAPRIFPPPCKATSRGSGATRNASPCMNKLNKAARPSRAT